ncbi:hypothetical protein B5C34_06265 [Pacificimonas flava]|uniref:Glycosyltransferase n=2 Tax=Pacificimonas TaxID=1960290 RepID=A0A219B418_9SPHN|nr:MULTISPECIES: glycosyltransferase [Pacificimonas]MBZ6377171.1 glycosyltransferase family 4 protein [Pacificimonas aurantium]OWV33107.1 hypothetical protein B5C34_06265 [Pacificimonas flava]
MTRVDVFDLEVSGLSHVPFNRDLLRIIGLAHPGISIEMHGEDAHIAALDAFDYPVPVSFVRAGHGDWAGTAKAAYIAAHGKADHAVVLGAGANYFGALLKLAKTRPGTGFDFVGHSELAEPARWRSRNPLVRRRDMFGLLARRFPANARLVVLEPAILDGLDAVLHPKSAATALPHPCAPAPHQPGPVPERPTISFLGGTFRAKRFDQFLEAARLNQDRFRFAVVGSRFGDDYDSADDVLFEVPPAREKLPRDWFASLVERSDLICLPLDPVRYSHAASGTLLDAAAYGIPLITTRTAVTLDWERRYGPIGYLVEQAEDIPPLIGSLDREIVAEDRGAFRASLERAAEERRPEQLAKNFRLHPPS